MARKKDKPTNPKKSSYLLSSSKGKNLNYRDLKRQAIILGMPFPDACGCGIFGLINYIEHADAEPDPTLIDKFDQWISKQFDETGVPMNDPIRSPRLRLGFIGDEVDPETGEVIQRQRRVPGIKKPKKVKPKREKDSFGHVKGTKKQYVWDLTLKGYSLERVTRRVLKKFPEANAKSISLWYRSAKRDYKKNGIEISIQE
jgi:hypothetical protein